MPLKELKKDLHVQLCVEEIKLFIQNNKIKQKKIVVDTGITQPQLSKILSGKLKRTTNDFLKLCEYAGINYPLVLQDPFSDIRIKSAMYKIWDGRDETVMLIVRLLECAAHVNNFHKR